MIRFSDSPFCSQGEAGRPIILSMDLTPPEIPRATLRASRWRRADLLRSLQYSRTTDFRAIATLVNRRRDETLTAPNAGAIRD
jgi:hypothetical protein